MPVAFADLQPEVLPECPGCPGPLAVREIRNAAILFCERSTYWRADHAAITTVTGESAPGEYTLTIPAGAQIVSVVPPIMHNDLPVYQKSKAWLDENVADWAAQTGQQANYYRMLSPVIVRLVPYPTTAQNNALKVRMALKPARTATTLDDTTFEEWFLAIAAGAKAALMAMKEKQWSNATESLRQATMFEDAVVAARSKAISEYQNQTVDRRQRSRGHFF
jgi:hypothetical protein